MDVAAYAVEAEVQETHWWFIGRRRLFSREIGALELREDAPMLDVGTGTGTNLRMLGDSGFQRVAGLDLSDVPPSAKAETLLVLDEQPDHYRVLIMFDGIANGGPREFRIPR